MYTISMKKFIYVDNAATSKLDPIAYKKMKSYLIDNFGNASQPYSFSRGNKKALHDARKIIAACINAKPNEIFFTSGGTESDNWALRCLGEVGKNNNHIVTSCIEHHAILNTSEQLKTKGTVVDIVNVDQDGSVDLNNLENILKKSSNYNNTLVSIMLVNNEIGTIEPLKQVVNIAKKYKCYVHTDAVQAIGHINIDVQDLGVDLMSASAHKFNGPKGVGFLYVKEGTKLYSFITGGSQESGYRAGTENVASIVGMAIALKNNIDKLELNQKKLKQIEERFINELNKYNIDYIRNGAQNHVPGLINISIKNQNGEMLLHRLDLMGVLISTGSACDSKNNQVSHVIKSIKVNKEYEAGTIRISFGKYNTISDAEIVAKKLHEIIHKQ